LTSRITRRNVLLYLNMAAQDRVVRRLRDALANQGVLVLGKGELALPAQYGLSWVNRRHRVAKAAEFSGMTG
jgi:chemotaxis methyl-accepting protein methylase